MEKRSNPDCFASPLLACQNQAKLDQFTWRKQVEKPTDPQLGGLSGVPIFQFIFKFFKRCAT